MKLFVYNCDRNFRKEVRNATNSYLKFLIPIENHYLIDALNIKIKFIDDLDSEGYCESLDSDEDFSSLDYKIEIKNELNPVCKLIVLAHEIVHVKQYLMGELDASHRVWRGLDVGLLEYDDQPWEKEAHKLEMSVYGDYVTSY